MEGVAVNMYRNLKGICTRRNGYKRLTVANRRRRITSPDLSAADLSRRRRRFWRIRRPKLRLISPKKFLIKLRDAYINFMLRLASSPAVAGGSYGGGYGGVDYGGYGFGVRPVKEYDEKMIIEIYKSLVKAHGHLVVRDAGSNYPPRGDVDDLAIQRLR